jgi:hypothetical protein
VIWCIRSEITAIWRVFWSIAEFLPVSFSFTLLTIHFLFPFFQNLWQFAIKIFANLSSCKLVGRFLAIFAPQLQYERRSRMDYSDFRNSAKIPPASLVMASGGSLEIRAADARIPFWRGNRAFYVASNC